MWLRSRVACVFKKTQSKNNLRCLRRRLRLRQMLRKVLTLIRPSSLPHPPPPPRPPQGAVPGSPTVEQNDIALACTGAVAFVGERFPDFVSGVPLLLLVHFEPPWMGRAHGVEVMSSCWVMHGAREFMGYIIAHCMQQFRGEHANSHVCTDTNSMGGVRGGTKPLSMSTRCKDWRPGVEKPASLQQASGRLHGVAWAGRVGSLSLPISQEVEIIPGCADTVSRLPPPFFAPESPGPGRS